MSANSWAEATPGPPRVLHLLSCDNWGGTEVQVTAQILRSDPSEVHQVVAILEPPGVVADRLRTGGVEVHPLHGTGGVVGRVWRLIRVLRSGRFDLLEVYGFRAGLVARAARLVDRRTRLIVGVRGLHFTEAEQPSGLKTRVTIGIERLLSRTVTCYDANSRGARNFLVERGIPDRFVVILNGVDAEGVPRAEPARGDPPIIVSTARFVPRKRQEILLRALRELVDRGVEFRCELIGYGPTEAACKRLSEELDLASRVEFLGRRPQRAILDRLSAAQIFVLNSLWEGMPGSILEAMAAGLPVVATDVNGTDEVVEHEVTGLLVPVDDAHALAHSLARLLAKPRDRARFGASARARVEDEFTFERVVREKTALYRRLGCPAR